MDSFGKKNAYPLFLILFFLLGSFAFAADMSILDYDAHHGMGFPSQISDDDDLRGLYDSWLVKHGKAYNALGEKEKRFEIFKDNLKFIEEHNKESRTYKVGLNRFSDLTNEEFRANYLGTKVDLKGQRLRMKKSDRYSFKVGDKLPGLVDWREKGAVASVKDQGQCGECIVFSYE